MSGQRASRGELSSPARSGRSWVGFSSPARSGRRSRKGFFSTLAVLVLAVVMLATVAAFVANNRAREAQVLETRPVEDLSFRTYDSAGDLIDLAGITGLGVKRSNNSFNFTLRDSIPSAFSNARSGNYSAFIANNFSKKVNANYSLDLSGLSDGSFDILLNNSLDYSAFYSQNNSVLYSQSGAANITGIYLNIAETDGAARQNTTPWSYDGAGVPITLVYSDNAGTFTESGLMNGTNGHVYTVTYSGGKVVTLNFGSVAGFGTGAFKIGSTAGATLSYTIDAKYGLLSNTSTVTWSLNATMNYTQANVLKSGQLELGRS